MNDPRTARQFDVVRITGGFEGWVGERGVVAYVGTDGVSVAIRGMDDYVPLRWDEFEVSDGMDDYDVGGGFRRSAADEEGKGE